MPIDELLSVLEELRQADAHLAGTAAGSEERRRAICEVQRLERIAFSGALRPEREAWDHRLPVAIEP